ncbi:hypothetical protein BE21_04590 [Sorangium cellulosum]|uniref:Tail sheath protein C-terminal domain-containing protein n=1 Tax=Sorangium cellulosum TaxID=56 RepID=A0A150TG83_SORCE|nr:hypothetical protein BE21_04590 [Sorangium cellulosum]
MRAPGIEIVRSARPPGAAAALRADIVGFAGIFERGPALVARRVEDWGEYRAVYGGFVPISGAPRRQALSPLALHGFFQNGGAACVLYRLASPGTRAARAALTDPATGREVVITASSPGNWANGIKLAVPLVVRCRRSARCGFPLARCGEISPGALVRVTGGDKAAFRVLQEGRGGRLWPDRPLPHHDAPLAIEVIDPIVEATIEGAGIRERFHGLSLLPGHPRYLWSFFAVQSPLGPAWAPAIPPSWQPLNDGLARALGQQGPGASALIRSAVFSTWSDAREADAPLRTAARPPSGQGLALEAVLGDGADALGEIDAAAIQEAIRVLACHPAPSVVCIPELMLPVAPAEREYEAEPADIPLEPEAAPPQPCAPGDATPPPAPLRAADARLAGQEEPRPEEDLPSFGDNIALLQEELITTLASTTAGRERIALLDPLPGQSTGEVAARAARLAEVADAGAWRLVHPASLGTMLYPWIRILDPAAPDRRSVLVPPSGHVAGLLAASTRLRGSSAPFGGARIVGTIATERSLSEADRAQLNERQVSAIHAIAGRGVVAYGERTLQRVPGPDRYVPGARVLAFLRRALRVTGETLVFEPNDPLLQTRASAALEEVLNELFRQGALAGATATSSYAVRCDEALNPEGSIALGRLIAEVDVAIAVPLEFLTIRVSFGRDGSVVIDDLESRER